MVSEQSLVKNVRIRCLERGWPFSCFFTKLWKSAWQHNRPHPLHIAPPAFPRSCKDHQDISVKGVSAPHTRGSAQSETLKREEKKPCSRLPQKAVFLQHLLHRSFFYFWGGATGIERGWLGGLLLPLPLSLFEFSLNLHWSGLHRFSDMPDLFSPIHVGEYAIDDNNLLMHPTMYFNNCVRWFC